MTTELTKEKSSRPTNRRYASVKDFLKGEDIPGEVLDKVSEIESATKLVQMLSELRLRAGLTQEQMGSKLGVSQSAISKLESGRDEDLTIAVIRDYAKATSERIGFVVGKPLNHVEAIKAYAMGMKEHLLALAAMANQYDEMEREIQAFFGEAFFNILNILSHCQQQMPRNEDVQIKVKFMDQRHAKASAPSESRPELLQV